MATDKRELILARLVTELQALVGSSPGDLLAVYRDRGPLNPTGDGGVAQLPAAIVLDGDEVPRINTKGHFMGAKPAYTQMTIDPEIWVILMPRDNATNTGVAEELSAFRQRVLKQITNSQSLVSLLGSNGEIEYRGCTTDMKQGRMIEGQICLLFGLSYSLDFRQL